MTRYARSDIQNFIPPGGICPGHTEPADAKHDAHFSVDCMVCDPLLAQDPLWAGHPDAVPLTEVEQQVADRLEQDAQAAQARFALEMARAGMSEASKRLAAAELASQQQVAAPPAQAATPPARTATKRKPRAPKQQSPAQA